MNQYSFELTTTPGIADSDVLDRLAELVYEIDELVNATLGLNDDGSVTAEFEIGGVDPLVASQAAISKFLAALAASSPLRLPTTDEVSRGLGEVAEVAAQVVQAQAVETFAVTHVDDREAVPA